MRTITVYYTAVVFPLIILFFLASKGHHIAFGWGLLMYALIYRPVTDYLRLKGKGLVTVKKLPGFFIPFLYSARYFRELYFK